ncbi:hypothetical protein V6N13_041554 [Hibiscus sabdariffa]
MEVGCSELEGRSLSDSDLQVRWDNASKEVEKVIEMGSKLGVQFIGSIDEVGNGGTVLFWKDTWCGNRPLKLLFSRLYRLPKRKLAKVEDLSVNNSFRDVVWEDVFSRPLLGREFNILAELQYCLLDTNLEDKIIRVHDRVGIFSLKKLSYLLTHLNGGCADFIADKLCKVKNFRFSTVMVQAEDHFGEEVFRLSLEHRIMEDLERGS